jgi:hypothetical protein
VKTIKTKENMSAGATSQTCPKKNTNIALTLSDREH